MGKKILVTGAAGFIGFHVIKRLLDEGDMIVGVDNMNDYYDPQLKQSRLDILLEHSDFQFFKYDLVEEEKIGELFDTNKFDVVIHLAAQAGVRYSITNPDVYVSSNLVGFYNILEAIRAHRVEHFLYASSSSVYGGNKKIPFSANDPVNYPISLYAATKRSNELMAHAYSHLYNIPSTGLRFFTVYGPWGRPDMALYKFAEKIVNDEPIDLYNNGDMKRDFTYIDDIVESIVRLIPKAPKKNSEEVASRSMIAPYRLYNIGSNNPVNLLEYVSALEKHLVKEARKNFIPLQPGDVKDTFANVLDLVNEIGYTPNTKLDNGIREFVDWFKTYQSKKNLSDNN